MFGEGFCNLSHKIQLLYLYSEVKNTLFNMVTTGQEMATGKNNYCFEVKGISL